MASVSATEMSPHVWFAMAASAAFEGLAAKARSASPTTPLMLRSSGQDEQGQEPLRVARGDHLFDLVPIDGGDAGRNRRAELNARNQSRQCDRQLVNFHDTLPFVRFVIELRLGSRKTYGRDLCNMAKTDNLMQL